MTITALPSTLQQNRTAADAADVDTILLANTNKHKQFITFPLFFPSYFSLGAGCARQA